MLNLRVINTRSGKRMAVMTLEDKTGRIDVTLFNEVYQKVADKLDAATILLLKGSVAKDDYTGGVKVIADAVLPFEEARERMARELTVHLDGEAMADAFMRHLPLLREEFGAGRCPVTVIYQNDKVQAQLQLGDDWRIKPSADFLTKLYELCGQDKVELRLQ
jgi:DNA polymerase-3 subunit alpha